MIEQKVIICGVCKDVEKRLPHSIKIVEKIGSLFEDYKVIVFENNSEDLTKEVLFDWIRKNHKVKVILDNWSNEDLDKCIINKMDDGSYFKPELIAKARNVVMDVLEDADFEKDYEGFNYVIWIDLDFVLEPDYNGFVDTFVSSKEWDMVSANGIAPNFEYWDKFAFRDRTHPFGAEITGHNWWFVKKTIDISKEDWHPVYSAFGGCGIYKRKAIHGCRYSGIATEDTEKFYTDLLHKYKYPQIKSNNPIFIVLDPPLPNMKKYIDYNNEYFRLKFGNQPHLSETGFLWRMNSFTYQYPALCEHVSFHASMSTKGYDKFFVNPKLVFRYGDMINE